MTNLIRQDCHQQRFRIYLNSHEHMEVSTLSAVSDLQIKVLGEDKWEMYLK